MVEKNAIDFLMCADSMMKIMDFLLCSAQWGQILSKVATELFVEFVCLNKGLWLANGPPIPSFIQPNLATEYLHSQQFSRDISIIFDIYKTVA